jgi:Domain of unknown function (DUF1707)
MTEDRFAMPQMKASDADRDVVLSQLSEHFQAGRLTAEELDERTSRALAARTLDELDDLMTDLPGREPHAPYPPPGPQAGPAQAGLTGLRRYRYGAPAVALAAIAVVAVVIGVVGNGHDAHLWWIIPIGLLVGRRFLLRGGRSGRRGSRWD